ncbi:hypothetical protein [Millisia brevis]|uniref:hypothetical protein n=1 Tax=Millisia brevis TaxID=264148 RepID=UPI0012ECDE12|nr:hypothetical protein [Millisia brevis]
MRNNAADLGDGHDASEVGADRPRDGRVLAERQQAARRRIVRRTGSADAHNIATDSGSVDGLDSSEDGDVLVERPRIQPTLRAPEDSYPPDDIDAGRETSAGAGAPPGGPGRLATVAGIRPTAMRPEDVAAAVGDTTGRATAARRLRSAVGRRQWAIIVLVAALVGVLVFAAGYLFLSTRSAAQADAQRARLLDTARQTAVNLTTLHADTAREDVDRLLAGASGAFLQQFADRQAEYVATVGGAGVNTDGTVVASGIESYGNGCAVTLVAANATVTNVDVPDPQDRYFRFRITVCERDGVSTATNVEFVQ